jgi:hypothetical protein
MALRAAKNGGKSAAAPWSFDARIKLAKTRPDLLSLTPGLFLSARAGAANGYRST